jgi:hypothetical protein
MRPLRLITAVAAATAVLSSSAGEGPVPVPPLDPSGPVVIRYDDAVARAEPGPHGGGETTVTAISTMCPMPG